MAAELQHLIERIQREAVDTADQQAAKLLAEAREKAAALVRDAEAAAKAKLAKAEEEAAQFAVRSEQTIKQAARDLLLTIGQSVERVVGGLALQAAGEALTPEVVQQLLVRVVEARVQAGSDAAMTVLLSPDDQAQILAFIQQRYRQLLEKGLALEGDGRVLKGFEVVLEGGRIRHHFTAEAIAEALGQLLRPKLAVIVGAAAREVGGRGA